MANVITYGVAPRWGLEKNVNEGLNTLLINSVSTTPNVSEYLTKGGGGQTIGYVAYDQYIDWTVQGVLTGSGDGLPRFASVFSVDAIEKQARLFNSGGVGDLAATVFSVAKTVATTQTAGDAYQLTINGSIYPFNIGKNIACDTGACMTAGGCVGNGVGSGI